MSHTVWREKSIPAERVSFRPGVYGIVVQEGEVLFVNTRSTGKLFLPGRSEVAEQLEEALHREVREESRKKTCQVSNSAGRLPGCRYGWLLSL